MTMQHTSDVAEFKAWFRTLPKVKQELMILTATAVSDQIEDFPDDHVVGMEAQQLSMILSPALALLADIEAEHKAAGSN